MPTSFTPSVARLRKVALSGAIAAGVALGAVLLPAGAPATAASTTITVGTPAQLKAALTAALPGQVIAVADGIYSGSFASAASGRPGAPITLVGSRNAILSTGSTSSGGYGLHITGGHWNISGLTVTGSKKGIVLDDSDHTVIDGVSVTSIGQEAIHVRTSSVGVSIRNSVVRDTGLADPEYGEGIYIGTAKSNWARIMGSSGTPDASDLAVIENNVLTNISAEGIDIKEGTTGGRILGNTFTRAGYSGANYADSWIDVKGNDYVVSGNTGRDTRLDAFQVHTVLDGWGRGNTFLANTVLGGVPGYEVSIPSRKSTGNVVACHPTNAGAGLTEIACTEGAERSAGAPSTTAPEVQQPTPAQPTNAQTRPTGAGVTVDGEALDGSVQADGRFTASIGAPAGVTVKFKLDGAYLGLDTSAPYSWDVVAGPGSHKFNARWDSNGQRYSYDAVFEVALAGSTAPVVTPATPEPPVTPVAMPVVTAPVAAQPVVTAPVQTGSSVAGPAAPRLTDLVLVEGVKLDGAVLPGGRFTVTLAAPQGGTVRFKLDGDYLGLDRDGAYTWDLTAGPGAHKLSIRWDDADGTRHEVEAFFTVK